MARRPDPIYERSFPSFLRWLRTQYDRRDGVGAFAQRLLDDLEMARMAGERVRLTTYSGMDRHLRDVIGLENDLWAARDRAGREFNALVDSQ